MGIAGSSKISGENRSVKKSEVATEAGNDGVPPNPFREGDDSATTVKTISSCDEVDIEENALGGEAEEDHAEVKFV